jgi:parvulin-like peptidyl-prolyl isomerase
MTTQPRGTGVLGKLRKLAAAAALLGPAAGVALTQPPKPAPAVQPAPETRAVAYIYGTTPVTREELGEYLIARGGFEKLDLLVNRIVIELEAARRNVSATGLELTSALNEDIRSLGVSMDEFEKSVLPRYGKRLYEWEQDVIRPRILLGKICRDRVQVTEDEIAREFEKRYGEKREAQIIAWPKEKLHLLDPAAKNLVRTDAAQYEKLAAGQPDPRLAKVGGKITPTSRFVDGPETKAVDTLFTLKPGDVSEWIETPQGILLVKCLAVIPPENVNPQAVRADLVKDVADRKLGAEIPKLFDELRRAANPVYTQHVPPPQQTPDGPLSQIPRVNHPNPHVLAVLYGKVEVTREHLGEFLIARGGYEKLDVVVNHRVLAVEMHKRGITVTPQELDAAFDDDLRTLPAGGGQGGGAPIPITRDVFVNKILPLKKMSLFEYTEDVLKPRVVLGKLCRDRVKVTEEDVKRLFENKYGEKRAAKIILWPKAEARLALKQWTEARKGDAEFDRMARAQENPNLASSAGQVAPVGRYSDADNLVVENALFGYTNAEGRWIEGLQVGEVSQLFETPVGIMCVKYLGPVPPVGVTLDSVRAALEKEAFEKKLAKEIPTVFNLLKREANPNVFLKGPPSDQENAEGVRQLINQLPKEPAPKK